MQWLCDFAKDKSHTRNIIWKIDAITLFLYNTCFLFLHFSSSFSSLIFILNWFFVCAFHFTVKRNCFRFNAISFFLFLAYSLCISSICMLYSSNNWWAKEWERKKTNRIWNALLLSPNARVHETNGKRKTGHENE